MWHLVALRILDRDNCNEEGTRGVARSKKALKPLHVYFFNDNGVIVMPLFIRLTISVKQ